MNTKKIKIAGLCVVFIVLGIVFNANALTITPNTYNPSYLWFGNETSQAKINVIIGPIMDYAPELYKQDAAESGSQPSDEGPFAGSYSTEFNTDLSGGTIKWTIGSPYIGGAPIFLLVKDGNQSPAWYLFEINYKDAPFWDGREELNLSGFWPANGAISHVAIYDVFVPVPEPATILLLGLGFLGLSGVRRKIGK